MRVLGGLDNVICKLAPTPLTAADPLLAAGNAAPFIEHAVQCFGWKRAVFGSNWPASSLFVGVPEWVAMLLRTLGGSDPAELRALFSENARRLFRSHRCT